MSVVSFESDFAAVNNQTGMYACISVDISITQEQQYKFMYCCSDENMILVRFALAGNNYSF